MTFEFNNPELLWLLALLPLLIFLKGKRGQGASILFSSIAIAKKVSGRQKSSPGNILLFIRVLALAIFIIALARPQLGKGESVMKASGIDIVLAVDISGSMLALDFSTKDNIQTRLDVAKEVMAEFIERRPNDRIGLVAFAGDPYLVSPLTLNHGWLETNLERVNVGLVGDGTAIGSAIGMSVNRLRNLESKSKVVILLTDGVNNSGLITPTLAAEAAAAHKTKVYTITIGKGGIVPVYVTDNGKIVKNVLGQNAIIQAEIPIDEEILSKIAEITGAESYHATNLDELKEIYTQIDSLEKTEVELKNYAQYDELYMYPVIFGLLFLAMEQLLANTRFRRLP